MIAIMLTIHLALAAIYTISLLMLGAAAVSRKKVPSVFKGVYVSFGATIMTGAGLIIVSPKAITQFCLSTLVASIFGFIILKTYKHRVIAFQAS